MENIPAYVLGALDWNESSALKAHLETCQECQAELVRHQQISDGLLTALPPRTPSHRVRWNLLSHLNGEKVMVGPRRTWSFGRLAAGVLVLSLLGVNLLAFQQIRDLRQQHLQLAEQIDEHHTILGMLAASTEIHAVNGDGFSGNLLLDREKNLAYLLLWNLPPPPENQVYQIWLIDPQGEETGAGLFRPEMDQPFTSTALVTSHTFVEFVGIRVTIEPLGGSEMPVGEQILNLSY